MRISEYGGIPGCTSASHPGGPQKIMFSVVSSPPPEKRRVSWPVRCVWPTKPSNACGRSLSARGACASSICLPQSFPLIQIRWVLSAKLKSLAAEPQSRDHCIPRTSHTARLRGPFSGPGSHGHLSVFFRFTFTMIGDLFWRRIWRRACKNRPR